MHHALSERLIVLSMFGPPFKLLIGDAAIHNNDGLSICQAFIFNRIISAIIRSDTGHLSRLRDAAIG